MAKNNSDSTRFQYTIDRMTILRKGNRPLFLIAALSAALGILIQTNKDRFGDTFTILLFVADTVMILIGVIMIRYLLRIRKIPNEIKIRNHNLTVDNWTFLHNSIKSLKMTKPEKTLSYYSSRKLEFLYEGKKYKFFFGPIGGMPQKDYQKLYEEITACESESEKA